MLTAINNVRWRKMTIVEVAVLLQFLDFITTMAFFQFKVDESNPIVKLLLIPSGAMSGVIIAKIAALGLLKLTVSLKRPRVLLITNWIYFGIITWNTFATLVMLCL